MYNRTITALTSSEYLEKCVQSALLYMNIAEERVLLDTEYPAEHTTTVPMQEAKNLLKALAFMFNTPVTELEPDDKVYDLAYWLENEQDRLNSL